MRADRLPGRLARALLVVVAVGAVLVSAPTGVRTVLALAAVVAVAQRLAGRRGHGLPDAVLIGTGGVLVALVLTGLALDLVGVPLEPPGWALVLGLLGLLGVLLPLPSRPASDRPALPVAALLRQAPWALACVAVGVVAIGAAVRSAGSVDVVPVELSVGQVGGGHAQVVVDSERATGPLELRSDTGNGSTLSYPLFRLSAGGRLVTDVLLPVQGRTTITVNNPGQSQPLRTLIVAS